MSTTQSPRSDTRARIIDVALELFAEHGYEKTSLREIADRLGVTKAALYYHFKTKDDIVHGIVESMSAPIDEAIEWGQSRPWSPEVRDELVRRFAAGMTERAPLLRFFHENQPALRELKAGHEFRGRIMAVARLVHGPNATFQDRLRATMALATINSALFLLKHEVCGEESPGPIPPVEALEQAMAAALEVGLEISARIEPAPRSALQMST